MEGASIQSVRFAEGRVVDIPIPSSVSRFVVVVAILLRVLVSAQFSLHFNLLVVLSKSEQTVGDIQEK